MADHARCKTTPWPGQATLEISKLWLAKDWHGTSVLDGASVSSISTSLEPTSRVAGLPYRLATYRGRAFQGSNILGAGFTMSPEAASDLIARDRRNAEVLFPYINGEDFNSRPRQDGSRWVINFRDWPLAKAAEYPDCLAIVEELVRPERARNRDRRRREIWWQFTRPTMDLYAAVAPFDRVLCRAITSKHHTFGWVRLPHVIDQTLPAYVYDDTFHFGVLQSGVHETWWRRWGPTFGSSPRYTPTDCFETFPQPEDSPIVEVAGRDLDEHRSTLMINNDEGLTKTYNRVHNPEDTSPGIPELRELHVALDLAVRDAYGRSDLDLDHGFHDTPQGRRFTLGPAARTELLDRLLELNHERYAEEVAAGLHGKKSASKGRRKKPADDAPTLL